MSRGPAPAPTRILEARGSWRAKNRKHEPRPACAAPDCPAFLKGEARAEWDRQCAELLALGVLAKVDRAALVIWCLSWQDYLDADAAIRKAKRKSTGKGLAWARKDARDTLLKIAAQFGFTPAARARLKTEAPPPDDDPAEAFFQPSRN